MLKQSMNKKTALVSAVDFLAVRSYGTEELKMKLQRRGYSYEEINNAVELLTKRGYLDDATLCNSLFKEYCRAQKYSFNYILQKLMQKGFSRSIVESYKNQMDDEVEFRVAQKILLQKYKLPESVDAKLMMKYLYGKGFTSNVIEKAVSQYNNFEENY